MFYDGQVAERLTIDELAHRAQTKTSTVRLYQTKGLLPPPEIQGRIGYYSAAHIARLRVIERLQQRGYSLAARPTPGSDLPAADARRIAERFMALFAEFVVGTTELTPARIAELRATSDRFRALATTAVVELVNNAISDLTEAAAASLQQPP